MAKRSRGADSIILLQLMAETMTMTAMVDKILCINEETELSGTRASAELPNQLTGSRAEIMQTLDELESVSLKNSHCESPQEIDAAMKEEGTLRQRLMATCRVRVVNNRITRQLQSLRACHLILRQAAEMTVDIDDAVRNFVSAAQRPKTGVSDDGITTSTISLIRTFQIISIMEIVDGITPYLCPDMAVFYTCYLKPALMDRMAKLSQNWMLSESKKKCSAIIKLSLVLNYLSTFN
jgi:hypothetical protein